MNDLDENTEALLKGEMVTPPVGFDDTVMQCIAAFEREQSVTGNRMSDDAVPLQSLTWWQWLALTVGGLIGVGQVFRFVFAVWFVSAAG